MSERQAKLKRQNAVEEVKENKKSKKDIMMNIVIAVIVVAVIGLGVVAILGNQNKKEEQLPVTTETTGDGNVETLRDYAESIGMTAEDFIKEYGLEGNPGITPDTDLYNTFGNMTVENFAKAHSRPLESILEEFKNDYPNVTKDSIMFDMYATEGAKPENE